MRAITERRHRNQPRDHALFALLANTGLRPSEALGLTVADLHLRAARPWINVRRLKKQSERVDELEISPDLATVLRRFTPLSADPASLVFGVSRRQAERLFHFYARRAGVSKNRYLYVLRHTAATRIYRATRDIKVVQAVLGHESAETSSIYAHIPRAVLEELARAVPAFV